MKMLERLNKLDSESAWNCLKVEIALAVIAALLIVAGMIVST